LDDLEHLKGSFAAAGRYSIEREIGAGGMATVYLARDERYGRPVAIKILRQDLGKALGAERFHREIRIAAALQHPCIVPLYDSGEADGLLYYVMPFVEGTTLRHRLEQGGEIPIADVVRILRDSADALAAAHRQGVVHRDLKPENIMLSGRHALVTDFGVAKAVTESADQPSLTTIGVALGTPTYMAPEQVAADPQLDHRADIYAFGVVAYELFCGRPPFKRPTVQEVLIAHITSHAEPVTKYRATVPRGLELLVMRCLEKKPEDRWQTAEELIPHLEAELGHSGASTSPAAWSLYRRAAIDVRRRPAIWIGGAAMVAGLAWFGVSQIPRNESLPLDPGRVVVLPFETQGSTSDLGILPQVLESSIAQGLHRTGRARALESRAAIDEAGFTGTAAGALSTTPVALDLGNAAGAGLVVVGRILVLGDSARIEPRLLATSTGAELVRIPAESGPTSGATELAERVSQRVMGALMVHRDPQWGSELPGTGAPTYAAYRAFQEAVDQVNRGQVAAGAAQLRRAWELDTTFVIAAMRLGYALFSLERFEAVDSLGAVLDAKRAGLSTFETQYLNRLLAWNRGDLQAVYTAAQEIGRMAPRSTFARYTAARSAIFVNRMAQARDGLLALDFDSPDLGGVQGGYGDLTDVMHLLGDHEGELKAALEWSAHPRNQLPLRARGAEAVALVALGRLPEVSDMFPQFLTTRAEGNTRPTAFAIAIIRELRWHGADSLATHLSRVALERLGDNLTPNERLILLFGAGELAAAATLADSLLGINPGNTQARGWRGALAAIRGDRGTALADVERLERNVPRYDRGDRTANRASIFALLGERARAVELLQQAHAEGASFQSSAFHARIGLEPLRGFDPFEEFVRPK
jgi:tetratricopeptide (TPR) repeat protein